VKFGERDCDRSHPESFTTQREATTSADFPRKTLGLSARLNVGTLQVIMNTRAKTFYTSLASLLLISRNVKIRVLPAK
jgi:hypothetical protein